MLCSYFHILLCRWWLWISFHQRNSLLRCSDWYLCPCPCPSCLLWLCPWCLPSTFFLPCLGHLYLYLPVSRLRPVRLSLATRLDIFSLPAWSLLSTFSRPPFPKRRWGAITHPSLWNPIFINRWYKSNSLCWSSGSSWPNKRNRYGAFTELAKLWTAHPVISERARAWSNFVISHSLSRQNYGQPTQSYRSPLPARSYTPLLYRAFYLASHQFRGLISHRTYFWWVRGTTIPLWRSI